MRDFGIAATFAKSFNYKQDISNGSMFKPVKEMDLTMRGANAIALDRCKMYKIEKNTLLKQLVTEPSFKDADFISTLGEINDTVFTALTYYVGFYFELCCPVEDLKTKVLSDIIKTRFGVLKFFTDEALMFQLGCPYLVEQMRCWLEYFSCLDNWFDKKFFFSHTTLIGCYKKTKSGKRVLHFSLFTFDSPMAWIHPNEYYEYFRTDMPIPQDALDRWRHSTIIEFEKLGYPFYVSNTVNGEIEFHTQSSRVKDVDWCHAMDIIANGREAYSCIVKFTETAGFMFRY